VYVDEWIDWGDWLGSVLPFEEARVQAKSLNLGAQDAWDKMVAKGAHELGGRVPVKPDRCHAYIDLWQGWDHFLGNS